MSLPTTVTAAPRAEAGDDDAIHIWAEGSVLHLAGVLDGGTAHLFGNVVTAMYAGRAVCLTVSMAGVTFLDCRGLTVLLRARRLVEESGGRLTLSAVPPHCSRLLDLADLSDVFTVMPAADQFITDTVRRA